MKSPRLIVLFFIFGLVASVSACASATPTPAPTPVTVQLKWTHQAQFAGFYAADQKGYYAAEGLAVKFLEGGPAVDLHKLVVDGTAQFGVASADTLILARSEGKPLHAIATVYRRSPTVFIALADSGITRPQDLIGKKVRVTADLAPTLRAVTARVGIRRDQYTEVNLPSDLMLFASGEVPVWGVVIDGFALTAKQAGYKLNIIYPDDYGIHFYSDSIFATDDLIAKNPDLVRRFLRATLKGWTFAIENPTAVGQMVVKYKPDADVALENAKMTAALPFVNTGEDFIGWMKPEIWAGMEITLREQDVLTKPVDVTQVYTTQFLREIYGK